MADTEETAILRIHTRIVSITSYLFLGLYQITQNGLCGLDAEEPVKQG